jgi:hypothetical protein
MRVLKAVRDRIVTDAEADSQGYGHRMNIYQTRLCAATTVTGRRD